MKFLVPALACCLLACDVGPKAAVASAQPDATVPAPVAQEEHVLVIEKPIEIVQRRVPRHVLVIGDSEACAVSMWIDLKKTVKQINEEANQPLDVVDVECKGGTVIQYWGAGGHLKQALAKHPHPDDVLVFLGTNHYWQNQKNAPPTEQVTDLLKDTNCVWVGNTAVHGKKWPVNGLIRDRVTPQCKYFDTEAADIPLMDGVHPTPAGATKWIRAVWPLIPPKYEASDE